MIKKEKTYYKCLSEKDRKDLKKWLSRGKKTVSKKGAGKIKMDNMADLLKGKPYWVFLRSNYWKIIRRRVLDRDKNKCVICKSTSSLEIHHDSYKHHFREHRHLKDLMTLCSKCHKEHHYAQM